MSFTALIALAHENGFPLVVVLAGITNLLLEKTSDRLIKDLKANGNGGANPWLVLQKPVKKDHKLNIKTIQDALSIWNEKDAPEPFYTIQFYQDSENYCLEYNNQGRHPGHSQRKLHGLKTPHCPD